jgi:hypothetical protein
MPSSAHQSPVHHRSFWPAIIRTLLVEVLVLLALSGAIVGYLNWSSEMAWAEFKAASKLSAPESAMPVETVRAHAHCDRNA